jgi:EAL domain-containing protein (putative c-di-GMP-specific phosphodiesterase class I)/CheY-like chemotaxis protein
MSGCRRQTVLIVEDQKANREVLKGILSPEYDVKEAENGEKALSILQKGNSSISAVLLDLNMPVMNGYNFLRAIKEEGISGLPIIVMTDDTNAESEQRALDLGAWDFISKPYRPKILLSRLKNAVARSRMCLLDQMQYMAEHDPLTGLYNRAKCFREIRKMLDEHPDETFVFVRFDINRFSLFNTFWGEKDGDRFLRYIANQIKSINRFFPHCIYGHIMADIFCLCEPFNRDTLNSQVNEMKRCLSEYNHSFFAEPSVGAYVIENPSRPVESMYAKASMAAQICKRRYNACLIYYDKAMNERSLQEHRIVSEMQHALDEKQFAVYFQPEYNLGVDSPCGAEALVRWIHPVYGVISPGTFIPVFERNGFIGKLDFYMWDTVCGLLRKWIDEGLNPMPISVNVSRVNLYNPNLVTIFDNLVKKHGIPPSLLNLELTESAYMDNPNVMKNTVFRLQQLGFTIMMDDFGNGYSSLTALKDINVDVLKIDMNFLSGNSGDGRSEKILASVIRMAGWLHLPVIMEGVETQQQTDFLRSIGCGYVQGFFFARPMPAPEYEKLLHEAGSPSAAYLPKRSLEPTGEEWSPNHRAERIFNAVQVPLAIYEFDGCDYHLLWVNSTFNKWFGYGESVIKAWYNSGNCSGGESGPLFLKMFQEACSSQGKSECEYKMAVDNERVRWLHISLKYLGKNVNENVLVATFLDITNLKVLENHPEDCC